MKGVGVIVAGSTYPIEGFKTALRDLGWEEGRNISFEIRAAEGQLHQLPKFAAEMVDRGVDLIAVVGAVTVRAVRQVTTSIPIVFAVVVEPIADGLVADIAHPGRNITGATTFDPQQAQTQLQFLKAINPHLERVAVLSDLGVSDCMSNSNTEAAHRLQLKLQLIRVQAPSPEYERAFALMERERAQALVVLEEPINQPNRKQIAELSAVYQLPTVFPISMTDAGGLLAYGTDLREAMRHMGSSADEILKGASPSDLPIKAPRSPELVVNLQTARRLGVNVPSGMIARASRVIH